jgi:LysR family transcriptional regulator, glycine cleavage system transcriptional activator
VIMTHRSETALPPMESLQTAVAVARMESISAAALTLNVTHGAISRRIAALEQWLGMALFERHARGVRLTPDGQRFLGSVDDALALIGDAAERWRAQRGSNVVRISVTPSFATLWLLAQVPGIEAAAPPIRLEITAEHRTVDLAAGEADIAIRYGRGTWRGVAAEPLFADQLYPVARREVVRRIDPAGGAGALLSLPLLHDSDGSGWTAWFAAHGIRYRPRANDRRFEDYTLVLAAAEAGLGIALGRSPIADRALARARLVRVMNGSVVGPRRTYLLTRPDEARPAVLHAAGRIRAGLPAAR